MSQIDPGERLALGLTIDQIVDLADEVHSVCPRFFDLPATHQAVLIAQTYSQSAPAQVCQSSLPGSLNWDKIFEFIQTVLPLILTLLADKQEQRPTDPPPVGALA